MNAFRRTIARCSVRSAGGRQISNVRPPGFVGAATGLAVGNFYISPIDELSDHPRHRSSYGASTSKQMSGNWTYYSEDFVERTSDS